MAQGNLLGTIVDEKDAPLFGATVTLIGATAPLPRQTDADGKFQFDNLAPRTYELSVVLKWRRMALQMILGKLFRRQLATFLSIALLLPTISTNADAQSPRERVVIHVGAPSIWSMGQAHYLLARMHRNNRDLETNKPDKNALDPNTINSTRLQMIRSLLEITAQFDQKLGVENRAKLREYERKLTDRDSARNELVVVTAQLQALDSELAIKEKNLALKKLELDQIKSTPGTPRTAVAGPSEEVKQLEREIALLNVEIQQQKAQRAELQGKKNVLESKSNEAVDVTGLTGAGATASSTALPSFSKLGEEYLQAARGTVGVPKLAATIALDNFIGMQYEIISKQLTLLRDEVGPEYRIIFLELPASIYTAAGKGDDYLAQVQWRVDRYALLTDEDEDADKKRTWEDKDANRDPATKEKRIKFLKQLEKYEESKHKYEGCECEEDKEDKEDKRKKDALTPIIWKLANNHEVRALDIIPHQSSLNINEVKGRLSDSRFAGLLNLLNGFGLSGQYRRQSELYDQVLQQETFATGFGKGLNTFGWTFGPMPGTKRIAPGVRTMYAVLAVPNKTKFLEITASGVAYHRKQVPDYVDRKNFVYRDPEQQAVEAQTFNLLVPNEITSSWYVDKVRYSPVSSGETASVIIRGTGFSPQTSILVDGVPLKNVTALGNSAALPADPVTHAEANAVKGEFEIVNSKHIALKFKVTDPNYVGTPVITLVAPERSSAINAFPLDDVNSKNYMRLDQFSLLEPMFIEKFKLDKFIVIKDKIAVNSDLFVKAKLKGEGFRRGSSVWLNNQKIDYDYSCEFSGLDDCLSNNTRLYSEFVVQVDTKEYFLYFRRPAPSVKSWEIRYRQPTVRGFEVGELTYEAVMPSQTGKVEVVGYSANPKENKATLELKFFGRPENAELLPHGIGRPIHSVSRSSQQNSNLVQFYRDSDADDSWRALFEVDYEDLGEEKVERASISIRVTRCETVGETVTKTTVISLPLRPKVSDLKISAPPIPGESGSVITILGINLQNVAEVFISSEKATIVGAPGNFSMTVKLAKGVFIKEEKGVKVPVTLKTKSGESVSAIVTVGKEDTVPPPKPKKSKTRTSAKKQ